MADGTDEQRIDGDELRRVMATYPTGITVLTARHEDGPVGMAANSFVSVSLDPPLVAFCAAHSSSTWPLIEASGAFVVNIMGAEAGPVAGRFAAKDVDRFDGVDHRPGVTGAPVLEEARSYLECEIHDVHEAGDHVLVLGRVVATEDRGERPPLVFYGSRYRELAPVE